jgi:maltooligosyltrehalose synthase
LMPAPKVWQETLLPLFPSAPTYWQNVLTGEQIRVTTGSEGAFFPLDQLLNRFPVALLAAGV